MLTFLETNKLVVSEIQCPLVYIQDFNYQIQVFKYKYSNTSIQIQVFKYKYSISAIL